MFFWIYWSLQVAFTTVWMVNCGPQECLPARREWKRRVGKRRSIMACLWMGLEPYINQTKDDLYTEGFIGDTFDDCQLWLFADADCGGEHDSKSTSGCAMVLVGPNTYFPLNAFSKKQTA